MKNMPTVAYITNQFPSLVEWYVVDEIQELRARGVEVIPCSAQRAVGEALAPELIQMQGEALCLEPLQFMTLLRALCLCVSKRAQITDLVYRILFRGNEPCGTRVRALLHSVLGACFAVLLRERRVDHIHVHHGYFASWIALVAARLLKIPFSVTLHGSDLLLHATFMNTKLQECEFCVTVSEYNRRYILSHYPEVDQRKIIVRRMGVEVPPTESLVGESTPTRVLLAVGRLHPVKNHVFLLRACYMLRELGLNFRCLIVGDGPERRGLEFLIRELGIEEVVTLAGSVPRDHLGSYYRAADLVVLTSHSEGIPLVLMEAMSYGKLVLATAITGIPELVIDGKTGFLYEPGALEEFVWRVLRISNAEDGFVAVRGAAREHVVRNFNRRKNLEQFADLLLERLETREEENVDENLVLQQV